MRREFKTKLRSQNFLFVTVFYFLLISDVVAARDATEDDFFNLTNTLLREYKLHVRPIANQSAALDIYVDFNLISIYDVDDVNQVIVVMAAMLVSWYDKNLVWEPIQYGGLDEMHFGPDKIWAPKIYFLNSHDKDKALFEHPTHHVISREGKVMYFTRAVLSCQCKLDLVLFPSDRQRCEFPFAVFDASPRDVHLNINVNSCASNSSKFKCTEHGEWDVEEVKKVSKFDEEQNYEGYVTATSVIEFRRRPAFYYLNIYAPVFTIAGLCVLTFFVPVDSGERLAYALNMHLSLSVYIGYIGSILPMASLGMPNVFYVVSTLFFSSALCVAFSALNMALRWSIVITTQEGRKKIKILCFNFFFSEKGSKHTKKACQTKKREKFTSTIIKPTFVRSLKQDAKKNDNDIFTVYSNEFALKQSLEDSSDQDTNSVTIKEGEKIPEQDSSLESTASDQKSPGNLDPDLIKLCNTLDYYGFVLVSAFILAIVIMTLIHRKWF